MMATGKVTIKEFQSTPPVRGATLRRAFGIWDI